VAQECLIRYSLINDPLIKKVMALTGAVSKREAIGVALEFSDRLLSATVYRTFPVEGKNSSL
jgi:hypothetical protein